MPNQLHHFFPCQVVPPLSVWLLLVRDSVTINWMPEEDQRPAVTFLTIMVTVLSSAH